MAAERSFESDAVYLLLQEVLRQHILQLVIVIAYITRVKTRKRKRNTQAAKYGMIHRISNQVKHLSRMVGVTDVDCILNLRMNRNTFGRLCHLLWELEGLVDGQYASVEEQVAMFLSVLAHHKKNRVVRFDFWRSGQTISHYIHVVLRAILRLHVILLVKPEPVPEDCTDPRWKWFKGCLGALDGTYINVMISNNDKPRYRMRKGQISTNTLAVCDQNLKFVYVLHGWEGSAADSKILRDALNRAHGLKVPKGNYYLCDNGYANSEGFLTPFKGVRYHLKECGPIAARPQNKEELFNLKHSMARNVIERAFGIMKMRWGILRSSTFYPIKIHNRLIMACFLINNLIRTEMGIDPIEQQFDTLAQDDGGMEADTEDLVDIVESSPEWNAARDELAQGMWMDASSEVSTATPLCRCGNGNMNLMCAGRGAMHPGCFYYKCPANLKHVKSFMWCDEYHKSAAIGGDTSDGGSRQGYHHRLISQSATPLGFEPETDPQS